MGGRRNPFHLHFMLIESENGKERQSFKLPRLGRPHPASAVSDDNFNQLISYGNRNNHARREYQRWLAVNLKQHVVKLANDCGERVFLLVEVEAVVIVDVV